MFDELCVRLSQDETFLHEFTQKAIAWGITIVPNSAAPVGVQLIRATFFPKTFPKSLYNIMVSVNPIFNKLIDAICMDTEWLVEAHKGMFCFVFRLYVLFRRGEK